MPWDHSSAPPGRARIRPALSRIFLAGDYLRLLQMAAAAATGREAAREVRRQIGAGLLATDRWR